MSPELAQFSGLLATIGAIVVMCLYVVLSIVLAQATANDVDRLRESGREPQMLGSVGWALLVLVTNVVGVAMYWVMHYSSWRDATTDRQRAQRSSPRPSRD
jgi:hypothetical protein